MILTLFYHNCFIFSSKVIQCTSCVFNNFTVFVISELCFNEDSSSKEIAGQLFSLRHLPIWDIQQWKLWYFFPFSVFAECYWNLQMLHCNCKAIIIHSLIILMIRPYLIIHLSYFILCCRKQPVHCNWHTSLLSLFTVSSQKATTEVHPWSGPSWDYVITIMGDQRQLILFLLL